MSIQVGAPPLARPRSPGRSARRRPAFLERLQQSTARRARAGKLSRWEGMLLAAVLAVAAALDFIGLANEGYANEYYAAAVRSMLLSWHNFFFVSFDPGGFVTIDKPPVGFWLQTISAKLFGFHGWSLLLPQALAGVLAVALLWHLVRRAWGPLAGLVAALALALTPISVVTNRNNTIDSLLVLTLLGAAWAVTRAVESGRHPLRWLLLAGVLVGVGFNIKMLEAYLALPALWLAYLLAARARWLVRAGHLTLATVVLLAVSLSWATVVDLTPAAQRPYVGSSQTNSVLELALGYNGLQRLFGNAFGRGGTSTDVSVSTLLSNTNTGEVGGVSENGPKGLLRLIDTQLGGQIGWLIPLAVVGLLAAAWYLRPRRRRFWQFAASRTGSGPLRRRRASLLVWGTWFATMAGFFSVAGFYHRYYLTMLAPGVAALAGLGIAVLWRLWRRSDLRSRVGASVLGLALPAALVGTALVQVHILGDYSEWSARLTLPVLGLSGAAALALVVLRFLRRRTGRWATRSARNALATGVLALLLVPAVWSGISIASANNGTLPVAGPATAMNSGFGGMGQLNAGDVPPANADFPAMNGENPVAGGENPGTAGAAPSGAGQNGGGMGQIDAQMLAWLEAQQGDTVYLVAVSSANQASSIIVETGKSVMALGGFSGSDPILTTDDLAQLVANGTIRYVLLGGQGGGQSDLTTWITQHGTLVSASEWGGTSSNTQLYDLGTGQ
jgi:4-amino-4-deoxy-L-arabinose transferase-like glycosyltransferase